MKGEMGDANPNKKLVCSLRERLLDVFYTGVWIREEENKQILLCIRKTTSTCTNPNAAQVGERRDKVFLPLLKGDDIVTKKKKTAYCNLFCKTTMSSKKKRWSVRISFFFPLSKFGSWCAQARRRKWCNKHNSRAEKSRQIMQSPYLIVVKAFLTISYGKGGCVWCTFIFFVMDRVRTCKSRCSHIFLLACHRFVENAERKRGMK